ncbi:MAG: hypothetical protein KGO23_10605 [Nitrospirota bacterium]|nr:hypothetical protein [Nitrospirota bacterium]
MALLRYSELVELMNLEMEISAQDKKALPQLACGLKPDMPQLVGRACRPVAAETGTSSSLGSTDALRPVTLGIGREFSALRLYQCVSIDHG